MESSLTRVEQSSPGPILSLDLSRTFPCFFYAFSIGQLRFLPAVESQNDTQSVWRVTTFTCLTWVRRWSAVIKKFALLCTEVARWIALGARIPMARNVAASVAIFRSMSWSDLEFACQLRNGHGLALLFNDNARNLNTDPNYEQSP